MQDSNVISLPNSVDTLVPNRRVKMTADGLAYAGPGDVCLGTLLPSDLDPDTGAVLRSPAGLHYATLGSNTDVVPGDLLEAAADGKVVKRTNGVAVGVATESAGNTGEIFRVAYTGGLGGTGPTVIASGIHDWAGGAAAVDSIAVPGLLATDVVTANLVARAGAETLVLAANDAANDQIDLTLSANGTNGTTKVAYQVLRPVA